MHNLCTSRSELAWFINPFSHNLGTSPSPDAVDTLPYEAETHAKMMQSAAEPIEIDDTQPVLPPPSLEVPSPAGEVSEPSVPVLDNASPAPSAVEASAKTVKEGKVPTPPPVQQPAAEAKATTPEPVEPVSVPKVPTTVGDSKGKVPPAKGKAKATTPEPVETVSVPKVPTTVGDSKGKVPPAQGNGDDVLDFGGCPSRVGQHREKKESEPKRGRPKGKAKSAPKSRAEARKKRSPKSKAEPKKATSKTKKQALNTPSPKRPAAEKPDSTEKAPKKRKARAPKAAPGDDPPPEVAEKKAKVSGEKTFARRYRPTNPESSKRWEAIRDVFQSRLRSQLTGPLTKHEAESFNKNIFLQPVFAFQIKNT